MDTSESITGLFGAELSEDWTLIHEDFSPETGIQNSCCVSPRPQSKSAPLPAPIYRQDLSNSREHARISADHVVGGLAAPSRPLQRFEPQLQFDRGLSAPAISVTVPRSLQVSAVPLDVDSVGHNAIIVQQPVRDTKRSKPQQRPPLSHGPGSAAVTRVRCASDCSLVMSLWSSVTTLYMAFSPMLQQLQQSSFRDQHYVRLINNFAASTLLKYLSALQHFHALMLDLRLTLDGLTETQLADILTAGWLSRKASESMSSAAMMLKALRWGYKQLQIESFVVAFGSLLTSFQSKVPHDRRESLPFSLYILSQFERHILVRETSQADILILGTFLLLVFSGLRYADLQRTSPLSLQWDGSTLRGLAWRTKTSSAGTPFGAIGCGFLSSGSFNWLYKFLMTLDDVLSQHGSADIDFMIPSIGPQGVRVPLQPMSYAEGLYFLRKNLCLPWKRNPLSIGVAPNYYTIHGLKSTLISWATQLDLSDEHKRLQGKHQARNSSTRLYSRDDVHGTIKLQKDIVSAVQGGWRPVTPLSRGGQQPLLEPSFTLEKYNKSAPEHTWGFLRFHGHQFDLPEAGPALAADEIHEVEASSSSDSDTSSSDSSGSSAPAAPRQKACRTESDCVDEVIGALHRNTWHVMLSKSTRCDKELIHTACGRHFDQTQVSAVQELQLTGNQALCGHPGCRKGWTSVGA